ncbi:hypothetical protein M0L20_28680 [Spirosoma sp. RP8]|uniref:Uncharacterized protein n=1 Tax=Spirosoma liriopis TaxID=2937440 RepID=A0ABT0HUK4_9BACT|nr:hypothetical protein [Spirosoma liriopis]MCK8495876.1 hypothetical protein [Spirosoma liriopis]
MNSLAHVQRNRRLILMILLVLLGFAAGFVWGNQYGYGQGKLDTVKAIEKRFNAPEPTAPRI